MEADAINMTKEMLERLVKLKGIIFSEGVEHVQGFHEGRGCDRKDHSFPLAALNFAIDYIEATTVNGLSVDEFWKERSWWFQKTENGE